MRELATKEAVWAAAAALDAAGTPPTVVLIREKTSGGFTTIQKHLRSWQAAQAEAQAVEIPAAIDDQVTALANALARDLWRAATQRSATEIAQIRQQARAEVAQAEAERDGAYGEITRLEGEAEAEREQAAAISQQLGERTAQFAEAQRETQTLREALATARAQTQGEAARVSELERQLAGVRGELERVRAQGAAQITEAVAAIQQQLAQQAAQLQRLAGQVEKD